MEFTENNGIKSNCGDFSLLTVLSKYSPLVKSRAFAFSSLGEMEDLIQEGNIGLLSAAANFNSNLSSFSTFARRCIDSAIIDYLRKTHKVSAVPEFMLVDIDGLELVSTVPDPEYSVSVKEEYTSMLKRAKISLSEFEYAVFSDLLHGFTQSETAERKNVSVKSVHNAVQRIRTKLKG
jgi:RNA polymerase sporulation-specific sigma factor